MAPHMYHIQIRRLLYLTPVQVFQLPQYVMMEHFHHLRTHIIHVLRLEHIVHQIL